VLLEVRIVSTCKLISSIKLPSDRMRPSNKHNSLFVPLPSRKILS
jgi:hypothetical protein